MIVIRAERGARGRGRQEKERGEHVALRREEVAAAMARYLEAVIGVALVVELRLKSGSGSAW
jgi:hypothetical protein